ncbi:MAG TPA: MliC family protein [Candidatus Paceibacterota bacterium]|nr:MliC family protein [Candidatus Paceibacterota bacterium]
MKSKNAVPILITIIALIWIVYSASKTPPVQQVQQRQFIVTATYSCDGNKTITASFYRGVNVPVPQPGEPPIPGGSVDLKLSDGRSMTLPQTISASGVRYANPDESFIFWNKGNGAFIMENNVETYSNCVEK